jgi:small subunit ribosomal protein S18
MKLDEEVKEVRSPRMPIFVDYKNTTYLKQFLNPHGRMGSKKKSKVPAAHQRQIAEAVKRARFMGLLPYVSR